MSEPLKVGVAGIGNVGAGVVKLLQVHSALLAQRCGRHLNVTAISARDRARDRGVDVSAYRWHDDANALAADPEVDVVVELIGGSDGVAREVVESALRASKPVVTANKALLAHHGTDLARLAEENGVALAYEAAVAGGIPIVKALREGLAGNRIDRVYGILNGTCNYILTAMEESAREFDDVLGEAQSLGYAEADPSFDVDGVDAAHKLALLTSLAFGRPVDFDSVFIEGIRHVSAMDIGYARELGYRIKLLAIARATELGIEQRVHPCMVSRNTPIAHVHGVFNAVVAEGDFADRTVYEGRGAGEGPTASAVVADLVDVARGVVLPTFAVPVSSLVDTPAAPMEQHTGAYYVRLMVVDKPGVMADVAAILRDENVSLESVLQRGRDPGEMVPVILTTHETVEAGMRRALQQIGELGLVVERPRMIVSNSCDEAMSDEAILDRQLTIEALRASESAAIAAAALVGMGDERKADQVAVDAMRTALNRIAMDGTVVIGEGERDQAPMLFIGEKVGSGDGPKVDIAVDPLEGTTLTATGGPNAMSVVAISQSGGLLHAPDIYMDKLAVGGGLPAGLIDLDESPEDTVRSLASAKGVDTSDIVACILNRPRHEEMIAKVREAGARIHIIPDGDVAGVIATSTPTSGIDLYLGIGGAPQGVLAAAALRCVGGQMQGRLVFRDGDERGTGP